MQIGSKEWSNLIIEGAKAFDIDLNQGQTRQFAIHATELIRWNQKVNITAITEPLEVAVKHFLDSLVPAQLISPDAVLLDIGSGGGFPGLPLKILIPSLSVTLVDASRKKVNFLKHIIRTLKLDNIEALHIRAEDLANDPLYLNQFDVILSRAVSSLRILCRLAIPLLVREGVVIALKGDLVHDELNELRDRRIDDKDDPETLRSQFSVTVKKFHLPYLNSNRSIVIVKSNRDTIQLRI